MPSAKPRILLRLAYAAAAQEYLRSLLPEHFMEATSQASQRGITLASLALVKARRPDVQVFNELLVQYPRPRTDKPGQVVPDNMIVVHPELSLADASFDIPFEAGSPFCVVDYVSSNTKRKDYDDNLHKYEQELKVPYYLLVYPEGQEVALFKHNNRRYVSVKPNESGRFEIPELNLEVALLAGRVRYWYHGDLLSLPGQLQMDLDEAKRRLAVAEKQLVAANSQLDAERQTRLALEEELTRLQGQLGQKRRGPGKDM
jgi:Uma2 family endonuclease